MDPSAFTKPKTSNREKIGRTVAMMVQLMIDAPLQRVQLIMQTNRVTGVLGQGKTMNFLSSVISIVRTQGFFSLWRGSLFYLLTNTPMTILINLIKPGIMNLLIPSDFHLRNELYRFVILMGSGLLSDIFSLAFI
jgi:hypothetical protein